MYCTPKPAGVSCARPPAITGEWLERPVRPADGNAPETLPRVCYPVANLPSPDSHACGSGFRFPPQGIAPTGKIKGTHRLIRETRVRPLSGQDVKHAQPLGGRILEGVLACGIARGRRCTPLSSPYSGGDGGGLLRGWIFCSPAFLPLLTSVPRIMWDNPPEFCSLLRSDHLVVVGEQHPGAVAHVA